MHAEGYTYTHMPIHTYTCTRLQIHTYTDTHTRIRTRHVQTDTHTHLDMYIFKVIINYVVSAMIAAAFVILLQPRLSACVII